MVTYHPFIRLYIDLITEEASLNKLQSYNLVSRIREFGQKLQNIGINLLKM
jgi:hypothetical protein